MSPRQRSGAMLVIAGGVCSLVLFFVQIAGTSPTLKEAAIAFLFALLLTEISLLLGQGFAKSTNPLAYPFYMLIFGYLGPSIIFFAWTIVSPFNWPWYLLLAELLALTAIFFGWRMKSPAEAPAT